jgi:hypothetical protein
MTKTNKTHAISNYDKFGQPYCFCPADPKHEDNVAYIRTEKPTCAKCAKGWAKMQPYYLADVERFKNPAAKRIQAIEAVR